MLCSVMRVGTVWFPLKCIIWMKIINMNYIFIKNLYFFSTKERMTWTSWMTWG